MKRPLVGVTADYRTYSNAPYHVVGHKYLRAVWEVSGCTPIIIPAMAESQQAHDMLDSLDGLLFTGSPSNVHPSHYGQVETPEAEPFDPARDATSLALIRLALEEGLPLLVICRGFQELNVALGSGRPSSRARRWVMAKAGRSSTVTTSSSRSRSQMPGTMASCMFFRPWILCPLNGSTPITRTFGFNFFRPRVIPIKVPVVPIVSTTTSSLPPVASKISRAVPSWCACQLASLSPPCLPVCIIEPTLVAFSLQGAH